MGETDPRTPGTGESFTFGAFPSGDQNKHWIAYEGMRANGIKLLAH
jgi:hypothetical protein